MKCPACGGRGVDGGPDELGNYDPCDVCEGRGVSVEGQDEHSKIEDAARAYHESARATYMRVAGYGSIQPWDEMPESSRVVEREHTLAAFAAARKRPLAHEAAMKQASEAWSEITGGVPRPDALGEAIGAYIEAADPLVESEARQREIEDELKELAGLYYDEMQRTKVLEEREAVLVGALREIEDLCVKRSGVVSPIEKIARSALAGVVEAEPERCACGHPEREGWGHRSHECCPLGAAEPDGSER